MKTPTLLRCFALGAALAATVTASAQFGGLDKLTKDIDKINKGITKGKEIQEDVSKVTKGALGIGPKEEERIGGTVSLEIISRYGGLVREEEVMRRINLIGRAEARYSSRPDLPWRFGVLNSDSVNAFSAPYGYVFITRGLYDLCTNDDVLAGVLGHEISHVNNRDALKIIGGSDFGTTALKYGKKYNNDLQKVDSTLSQVHSTASQISPELGKLFDVNTDKLVKGAFDKGYGRETEYTADQDGRALASQTGYAPGGLRASLVMLQERGGDSKKFFPAHPPIAERLKKLPNDPAPGQ